MRFHKCKIILSMCLIFTLTPVSVMANTLPSSSGDVSKEQSTAADADNDSDGSSDADSSTEDVLYEDGTYYEGELIIVYDDAQSDTEGISTQEIAADKEDIDEDLDAAGIEVQEELAETCEETGTIVLASYEDDASIEDAIAEAESVEGVAYAQPNFIYYTAEDAADMLDDDTDSAQNSADSAITDDTDTGDPADAGSSADTASSTDTDSLKDSESAADTGSLTAAVSTAEESSDDTDGETQGVSAASLPNDPAASVYSSSATANQYYIYGDLLDTSGIKGANLIDAWDDVTTDNSVTIVILDTGVNLSHEDLQANLLTDYCYDYYNGCALEADDDFCGDYTGHGTHVAGIAAATANNGTGIAGASYNANIIMYKVFNDNTSSATASTGTIVQAYYGMRTLISEHPELNIRVANMSLGYYGTESSEKYGTDKAVKSAIQLLLEDGVLTVCAGGNGESGVPLTSAFYPSDFDNVLSVTALQSDGTNAAWSDFNAEKDISAPGVSIYATTYSSSSSYGKKSGTSMASPLVAGIAALLFAYNPDATAEEIMEAITDSADEVEDPDDEYARNTTGYDGVISGTAGAVNADAALEVAAVASIELPNGGKTLARAQDVGLTATLKSAASDTASSLSWTWSVENGTGTATIDADTGSLSTLTVGDVTVTATAYSSSTGTTYTAVRTITIEEIALDATAGPWATVEYGSAPTVTWMEAEAATGYELQRAEYGSDTYTAIATLEAKDIGSDGYFSYTDTSAETDVTYSYRVVPFVTIDGEISYGEASDAACGVCFSMISSLDSQADAAKRFTALAAAEGTDIDTVFVVAYDDLPQAIIAYGAAAAVNAPVVTVSTSELDSDAELALQTYDPDKVIVVGKTSAIKRAVVTAIKSALPNVTTTRCSEDSVYELAEDFYDEYVDSWGSTAFVISGTDDVYEDALSACSYAYAACAPVFTTDSDGELSDYTLTCLSDGTITDVIILGDTDIVGTTVETQLADLDVSTERIYGSTLYETNTLLAQQGIEEGVYDTEVYYFASADATAFLQASSLAGSSGQPLLMIGEDAEDVLGTVVTQESADSYTPIVYYDGTDDGTAVSDSEKERIEGYVQGDTSVIPVASTKISMDYVTAAAIEDSYTYTGSAIEPSLTLTYEDTVLTEGTDYTVTYTDNINAGTATATAYGINTYAGSLTVTFEITAAPVDEPAAAEGLVYTGSELTGVAADGSLYTVEDGSFTDAGSYTATVSLTDKENYVWAGSGTTEDLDLSWSIDPADIGAAILAITEDSVYTGDALTPALSLEYNGMALTEEVDYEAVYTDNTEAGTASVTVSGLGNYTGTVTTSFIIEPADLSDVEIDGLSDFVYSGESCEPDLTLTYNGMTLTEGRDYDAVFTDNTNAGTASVTITGYGNYTGTVGTAFSIGQADLNDAALADIEDCVYTGAALTPAVSLTYEGMTLEEGTDYEVVYEDNTDTGTASVTITGCGNYTGTVTSSFAITQADIADVSVTLSREDFFYCGTECIPDVTVTNGDYVLSENEDYVLFFADNTDAGTAYVTISGCGNFTGEVTMTFTILPLEIGNAEIAAVADCVYTGGALTPALTLTYDGMAMTAGTDYEAVYEDNVDAGTAFVTITGCGNYTGTITTSFTITPEDIKEALVTLSKESFVYDGTACTPEISVALGDTALTADSDYTAAYEENVDAGTAYAVITGCGNYTGTVQASFTILPASLGSLTISGTVFLYKGTRQTPKITVRDANGAVLDSSAYVIAYSGGCKAIGAYKVTVTGTDNYTGTLTKSFKILPKKVSLQKKKTKSKSKKKLTVKWKKVSGGVTSYQIRYRVKGKSKWKIKNVSGSKKSVVLKKLKSGKRYQVQVRAVKKSGSAKYTGSWSKKKTVKVK